MGLIGESGAGKSTIASLLLHFYEPDSGTVYFDERPAASFPLSQLRRQMAFVPQEVILFGGSIRENIAYGKPHATEEEIIAAARSANAHEFISESEGGYKYQVGESGNRLSGGQRQRISIARAIMANPPILILDEATSALDTESERLVQDAILKLMENRTSIVIAHRLSTIQNADLIVVLDEGRIVETGTHDELIKKTDGYYYKLHSYQAI